MITYLRQLEWVDYGIIVMALITAVIHIALGSPLFILNGLGYLALLGAIYLSWPPLARWQKPARWALTGYAALTIILYFVAHSDGSWMTDGLGLMTKLSEIILILLLLFSNQTST